MTVQSLARRGSLRDRVSEAEWQTRVDLAAFYRLLARYDMTDLTATHVSARVPGEDGTFLLNPFGLFFDEITASSLIKVDKDGRQLTESEFSVNDAGFTIHGAVLGARPDVFCAAHTHTRAGMAVSAMKCGLLPLTQHAMQFYGRLAYHDYEGVALDLDERDRLVGDLGSRNAMILRNHGLLTCGATIPEAFWILFLLEKSCQAQVDAMAGGAELIIPPPEVSERTARQFESFRPLGERDWPGHLRHLDAEDPSFRE